MSARGGRFPRCRRQFSKNSQPSTGHHPESPLATLASLARGSAAGAVCAPFLSFSLASPGVSSASPSFFLFRHVSFSRFALTSRVSCRCPAAGYPPSASVSFSTVTGPAGPSRCRASRPSACAPSPFYPSRSLRSLRLPSSSRWVPPSAQPLVSFTRVFRRGHRCPAAPKSLNPVKSSESATLFQLVTIRDNGTCRQLPNKLRL